MLSKLAIRRLTKLADFMDALPVKARKHFDMSVFFDHKGDHSIRDESKALANLDCGTRACALGWATAIPEFRRNGLKMDEHGVCFGDDDFPPDAAEKFFDCKCYFVLFASTGRSAKLNTPKQWARHCRKFLKANA